MLTDSIAAPITAPGRSAVAVVRVSGPAAVVVVERLVPRHKQVLTRPRELHLVAIHDVWGAEISAPFDPDDSDQSCDVDTPTSELPPNKLPRVERAVDPDLADQIPSDVALGAEAGGGYQSPGGLVNFGGAAIDYPVLDTGLVAYFPAPHSFTGEDCVEFNLHGSPFLVTRLLENLSALGIRLANPGEFTQRAFLNGQVDLSQAEAVADIINAETEAQARLAQLQLEGRLSKAIIELGEPLKDLLAEIEAYIDFPEEGIDPLARSGWQKVIRSVRMVLATYIDSYATGRLYREGVQIALAGYPNAGKSSLLNALCNEDRAIVTEIPGTTRDTIEVRVALRGLEASFWDTAGIVEEAQSTRALDQVEKLGIDRSWKQVRGADLLLYVLNPEDDVAGQLALVERIKLEAKKVLLVLNKVDLLEKKKLASLTSLLTAAEVPVRHVSAKRRIGIDELVSSIADELVGSEDPTGSLLITNQRHHEALVAADRALAGVEKAIAKSELAPEFVSLDIRTALGALQDIVGVTHSEDILGRIFSKFCVGK